MNMWGHAEMNWVGQVLKVEDDSAVGHSGFAGKTNI